MKHSCLPFLLLLSVLMGCRPDDDDAGGNEWGPRTPTPTALYRVTFEATWSAATHPGFYPAGAHFSPLIGASHQEASASHPFRAGFPASLGIKNMAELGNNAALRAEINAFIAQGKAFRLLDGRAATASPGSLTDTIRLSISHPALSVVTMIAPSPDWFAALDGVVLLDTKANEQGWYSEFRVPAVFYDAGTDSGPDFASPDQPTTPAAPIQAVTTPATPVGYFRLERIY